MEYKMSATNELEKYQSIARMIVDHFQPLAEAGIYSFKTNNWLARYNKFIEDDDITDPVELENTVLSQIDISNDTQDGVTPVGTGTFNYGDDIDGNIHSPRPLGR